MHAAEHRRLRKINGEKMSPLTMAAPACRAGALVWALLWWIIAGVAWGHVTVHQLLHNKVKIVL